MTYSPHTWTNGETITAAKLNNIETGIATVETAALAPLYGPFTGLGTLKPPMLFRLKCQTGALSYGSVSSDGAWLPYFRGESFYQTPNWSETPHAGTSPGTTAVVVISKRFIFPTHGACTILGMCGQLVVGVTPGSSSGTAYWVSFDIVLEKISAAGVVTTLNTYSSASVNATNGTLNSPYVASSATFNASYGAGYSLAAGEQLSVTIKVYGRKNGSATAYFALNADGGSAGSPTTTGATPSLFALTFA